MWLNIKYPICVKRVFTKVELVDETGRLLTIGDTHNRLERSVLSRIEGGDSRQTHSTVTFNADSSQAHLLTSSPNINNT